MFEMLKNIENQNCQSFGFCMVDPRINALSELLMNEIRQIAFYTVKIGEYETINKEIVSKCVEALCVDFSNINFIEKNFIDIYHNFVKFKIQMKNVYNSIHENSNLPYETIKSPFDEELKSSIIQMIKRGQKLLKTNHLYVSKQTEQLFELVYILIKDTSRNISRIKDFENDYTKYDFEVLRFLNIANFPSTRKEKLKRRIQEFIEINYQTRVDLQNILEENYGPKTPATVNLSQEKGHSILVSGDNFKELELVLEATKDEDINVYTHDMLFIAHSYEKFRQYKNLKGHFGTNNPRFDFSNFKGVIYVTKNYEQRIDSIVKGCIYTTNSLMPKGISKIENNNFEPLIKGALNHEEFSGTPKNNTIEVPYNENKIKNIKKNKTTLIVGATAKDKTNSIELFSPSEISLIYKICKEENKIEKIIFANCYLQTLVLSIILKIKFKYKIQFGKCPEYYVNPNLIKCLKEEYDIEFIE